MNLISGNVVLTEEHLNRVVEYFMDQDAFVFDVETVGTHRGVPHVNTVTWLSLATYGTAVAIPMGHPNGNIMLEKPTRKKNRETKKFEMTPARWDEPPKQLRPSQVFGALEDLFMSKKTTKVAHNATFDIGSIAKYYDGRLCPPPYDDTVVMSWLCDENSRNGLKDITAARYRRRYDTENVGRKVEIHPFNKVARYGYLDAKYTWLHYLNLKQEIKEQNLQAVYELETDTLEVLLHIASEGTDVDVERMRTLEVELSERVVEIEGRIYQAAGKRFNLNSPKQKVDILYGPKSEGGQGLKPWRLTKGGLKKQKKGEPTGFYDWSTDSEALESYPKNKVATTLLEFQEIARVLGTYVQGYLGVEGDPKKPGQIFEGRVYPDFVQYGTVTGRFSCVTADTLIETPRDLVKHPDGIPISEIKVGDLVYSFTWDRRLTLSRVKWCGPTKIADETVKVTVRDKFGKVTSFTATSEHMVRLYNGDWRETGRVKVGDRLMGLAKKWDLRPTNHTVISVEPGPSGVEVWDMEVEGTHNFIGGDVCLHNCRTPNLQNIPRPTTDLGKVVRNLFVAPPDHSLLVADYGQIELVVLAHFAGPGALYDGFYAGIDPHTITASLIFGVAPEDVTSLMRQIAKNINFAVVYGAGPGKVAAMSKTTEKKAKQFLSTHEREFPEIYDFKDRVVQTCRNREQPHILTLMGRKRRLPTIWAKDYSVRGKAERQAVNSLIQGSAADLIKMAMVEAHDALKEGDTGRLLLTVHDELVVKARKDKVEMAEKRLREAMTGPEIQKWVRVPLTIDLKIVQKWGDAK